MICFPAKKKERKRRWKYIHEYALAQMLIRLCGKLSQGQRETDYNECCCATHHPPASYSFLFFWRKKPAMMGDNYSFFSYPYYGICIPIKSKREPPSFLCCFFVYFLCQKIFLTCDRTEEKVFLPLCFFGKISLRGLPRFFPFKSTYLNLELYSTGKVHMYKKNTKKVCAGKLISNLF